MLPRWGMCRVQTGCLVFVSMLLSLMVLWVRWGTLGLVSVWSAVLFCCILGGYFQLAWPVSMTTHPRDHNHDQDQAKKKKIGCHGYGRRLSLVLWLSFLLFPLLLLVPSLPCSPLLSWLFIAKKCRKSSSDVCVVCLWFCLLVYCCKGLYASLTWR